MIKMIRKKAKRINIGEIYTSKIKHCLIFLGFPLSVAIIYFLLTRREDSDNKNSLVVEFEVSMQLAGLTKPCNLVYS
jgi:hypothetical protein